MRTPLQGVKHTLGTTTRDSTALRSRVSNQPSGLLLSAPGCGSQHPRVPWAARASCWPLPQQLLPASATGRGRRCCRSQRLGMSNVVAVSCNPYEESKEHGRPQAAKKSPVGSFLVPRVAAPSIRACLGRLAFLRIVSCAERIRVGEADNPKAAGSTPKSWRFPPVRREDLLTAFWGSANQKSLRDGRRPTAADAASRHDPFP